MGRPKKKPDASFEYLVDDTDRRILALMVRYPGIRHAAIADVVGVTKSMVGKRVGRPAFKAALQDLEETADSVLQGAAQKAARKIVKLIDAEDGNIAIQACKIALHQQLAKSQVDLSVNGKITYRTTVNPDGSIIQEALAEDARQKGEPK